MLLTYRNFIFDEKNGFIFAYVPKVACTNWKSILRYMAGYIDYLDNRLAHDKLKGGLRYLDLNGPDLNLLSDPDIRKYTFVRDPYSRSLSGYLNKIQSNLPIDENTEASHWVKITKAVEEFRLLTLDPNAHPEISFEVFLLWLRDGKSHFRNDEHWQSQTVLLRWPTVLFDFVGRFENLNVDADLLLKAIGCDISFPTQKEVKFAATGANDLLDEYLSKTCRSLIDEIFAADFRNFKYKE